MNDDDWTGVIFGMGVLILGTIILIVVLIVAERFYRARSQRQDLVRLTTLVEKYEQQLPRASSTSEGRRPTSRRCAPVWSRSSGSCAKSTNPRTSGPPGCHPTTRRRDNRNRQAVRTVTHREAL